jgi:hypothetical protein
VTQSVIINEVPPNRLPAETAQIGNGNSPLTSGNDQVATVTLSQAFVDSISGNYATSNIEVYTDFQESPFVTPFRLARNLTGFNNNSNGGRMPGTSASSQVELRIGEPLCDRRGRFDSRNFRTELVLLFGDRPHEG